MLDVDNATTLILELLQPVCSEQVALDAALGRILAEPLVATRPHPAFDNSAMDGYAVRGQDLTPISVSLASTWRVRGPPGPATQAFSR